MISDQSSLPTFTVISTVTHASSGLTTVPTMSSHGLEISCSDSVQRIDIVAEPVDPTAPSSGDQLTTVNVGAIPKTTANVEFTQNV